MHERKRRLKEGLGDINWTVKKGEGLQTCSARWWGWGDWMISEVWQEVVELFDSVSERYQP